MYDVRFGGNQMTKRLTITLVALVLFVMLAVLPVSAASANAKLIGLGGTVFIGESGLNLATAAGAATQIAWFPSTAQTTATVPEKTIDLTGIKNNFYVNPIDFGTRTGNWYQMPIPPAGVGTATLAFIAADPAISVKVWDLDQNKDVTGKSVPNGEKLTFRIETNGYVVPLRPLIVPNLPSWDNSTGSTYYGINPATGAKANKTNEGFIDIKLKTDQGNTLNAVYNATASMGGVAIPLTGMFIQTNPWYFGNYSTVAPTYSMYWNTNTLDVIGQKVYPPGTYTVTAEFNLNSMKDNYKNAGADYAGKTVSEAGQITIVSDTVKIEANKDTVVRSKPFSVTVTGKPNTFYWLWVKGTSQMTGLFDDQPPQIAPNQAGVLIDDGTFVVDNTTTVYGRYIPENKAGTPTQRYVWQQTPTFPLNGTRYWAEVLTNENGVRTIEFTTSNQTKAQKYTIRVENNTNYAFTYNYATMSGDYKTDEVDVKVEKGTVTITASGDGSYYLGEEVKFSGTNTETVKTYLFITGPNLKSVGSSIKDPNPRAVAVTDTVAADFKDVDVNADNSWSWKWATATVALDAGTYTVYAVSAPRDKDHLQDVAYGTVSIIVKKPFVSATVSQSTVARGDKVYVRGTAEGKPSPGVAMWILGKNYASVSTASVNSDATFEFEIKDTTTKNLAAGQYFVVVQHPMQNDVFDIVLVGNDVFNLKLGTAATGTRIFSLLGQGSLQGSDAAEALAQGINDPNVDDTYTKLQFLIEEPVIRIDAVGDRHVGDKFTITAQTNLAVDDEVLFEVYSSSFKPTQKSQSGEFSGATGTVKVTKGDSGMNKISFDVDASTFKPDEYIVKATAIVQGTTGTALFNVLEGAAPTAVPTAVVTTAAPTTVATTVPPTTVAPAKTPTQPGFGALVALIGLGAVAFLVVRKH
jgi:PGF-CTERM protein